MVEEIKKNICCEPFNPEPWQDKEVTWKDKLFVKDHVVSCFHIPINMKQKIVKNMALINKADAKPKQWFLLADEKSIWGSDIYFEVTKEVPDANMATLSGTFLTKVFEGPYKEMGKWIADMKRYVKEKNHALKQLYFNYTTCPKCAKKHGKNYVVLFAQI